MAKILVADDNSNIQKMVGLALKDHGIEVVAVGNGEAAVRKISDLRPDLVLADVFMPVRNGYEVCKYVKDDSALSHIPVILLVGAFDPLDEQEAQRVGADGVLKKPFVPPDPLISMVKSALIRTSTAQAAAKVEKAPVSAMVGGPASVRATNAAQTVVTLPKEEAGGEHFVDEIPAKPEELKIDTGGKPLAFGSLLEAPVNEPVDDAAFVTPASSGLADRDWSAGEDVEEEEEEEDSGSGAWRRDGGSEELAAETAEQATADKGSKGKKRESWTPTREKTQDLLEEVVAADFVAPSIPVKPTVIPEVVAPANLWAATKPEPQMAEPKEVPARAEVKVAAPEVAAPVVSTPLIASAPETVAPEPAKANGSNSWFSTSSSPWEAEAQKASQLASTWDAPPAPALSENAVSEKIEEPVEPEVAPTPTYDFVSEAPSEEPVHYVADPGLVQNEIVAHNPLPDLISDGSISPETVENIRQETSYALENFEQEIVQNAVEPSSEVVEHPTDVEEKIVETSQQDMDKLVANVLAKMSPEMLQAVTREILKPVVAAMIREEITKKS